MTGLLRQYIRHPDGTLERVTDIARYAKWFNDRKNRGIDRTAVPYGDDFKKAVIVLTVFLGFAHGDRDGCPILFETVAVMPDGETIGCQYTSEVGAREGHERIVREIAELLQSPAKNIEGGFASMAETPVPRPRKLKEPKRKSPDPECLKCGGSGEDSNAMLPDTMCECTLCV